MLLLWNFDLKIEFIIYAKRRCEECLCVIGNGALGDTTFATAVNNDNVQLVATALCNCKSLLIA